MIIPLIGCQPESNISSSSKANVALEKELLVYCAEGSPTTLNPQVSTSGTTIDATSATLFNQLIDYEPGTTNLKPSIATHWEVDETGLNYQFHLRQDIQFHSNKYFSPTRNLNADDVIFSLNRQRLTSHPLHALSGGNYPYFDGQGLGRLIQNILKINEHQIQIKLTRPESPFISIMATPFLPIQSKEYAEQLALIGKLDLFDKLPIGTGPFEFVDYQQDSHLRFKRFDSYFSTAGQIRDLVYSITPDPAMRFARFAAGECDLMRYPLPVHLKLAAQEESIKSIQTSGLNVAYWAFNTEKPPFDNPKVRQALSIAINRKAIIRSVYDDQAIIANSPLPPSSWAHQEMSNSIQFNPEQARVLLSEAGYGSNKETLSIDIWAMPVQRAYNPNARKMAEMIQQDLLEVGVKSQIISYQWGTFLRRVRQGEHQTVLLGWNADNGDPNNFLTPLLSCLASQNRSNYSRWCNKDFDQVVMQAREETNQELRTKHYHDAQEMFSKALPWVPIANAQNSLLVQQGIYGIKLSSLGSIRFEGIRFDQDDILLPKSYSELEQEKPTETILEQRP